MSAQTSLELVALKEIPIFDRNKRRQMVLELNSLYKNLKDAHRLRGAAHQEAANQISAAESGRGAPQDQGANGQEDKAEATGQEKKDDDTRENASRSVGSSYLSDSAATEEKTDAKLTSPTEVLPPSLDLPPIRSATMEAAQGIENVVAFKDAFRFSLNNSSLYQERLGKGGSNSCC